MVALMVYFGDRLASGRASSQLFCMQQCPSQGFTIEQCQLLLLFVSSNPSFDCHKTHDSNINDTNDNHEETDLDQVGIDAANVRSI